MDNLSRHTFVETILLKYAKPAFVRFSSPVAERCAEPRRSIGREKKLKNKFVWDGRIEVPTVGINQSINS